MVEIKVFKIFLCFSVLRITTCSISGNFTLRKWHINKHGSGWTHLYNINEITNLSSIKHIPGETYLEITNFLHGYIINMKNMHPSGQCRQECKDFTRAKTEKCLRNKWCKAQPRCSKIYNCDIKSVAMEVCRLNMYITNRRYQYISEPNQNKKCTNGVPMYLETQERGLFDICDYCYCTCEEDETPSADRYISLRTAMADVDSNRVVTGIRFVKHNRIIHFQVQDGKLMPRGKIDVSTLRWVPVPDYRTTDKNVHENVDYHKLSWQHRSVYLDAVFADGGFAVTGVRFKQIGSHSRLNLQIVTTPFNFVTGELTKQRNRTIYKLIPDIGLTNKFAKELKLTKPDLPSRDGIAKIISTTNKYVRFTTTDYDKDAGQSTVPFFDAKPVQTEESPLIGVGIFHRGVEESGGFITPKIYAYEFENVC